LSSDLVGHLRVEQLIVHEFLIEAFPCWWIGHGSATPNLPVLWPSCSPNLTTPDNSLWGIMKDDVAACHCSNNAELRATITDAFASLTL
jgi:hypothetical protein